MLSPKASAAAAQALASAFTVGLGGIEPPTSAFHLLAIAARQSSNNPSELDSCGARWSRTIGLSIISAGQGAGQAIGTRFDLPFRARTSH